MKYPSTFASMCHHILNKNFCNKCHGLFVATPNHLGNLEPFWHETNTSSVQRDYEPSVTFVMYCLHAALNWGFRGSSTQWNEIK